MRTVRVEYDVITLKYSKILQSSVSSSIGKKDQGESFPKAKIVPGPKAQEDKE